MGDESHRRLLFARFCTTEAAPLIAKILEGAVVVYAEKAPAGTAVG